MAKWRSYVEGLLIIGAFVTMAPLPYWFGYDSRNCIPSDEPSRGQAWRRKRVLEMLDPFSFHLEVFVRQKLDRYEQEAARERLIRSIGERPMKRICETRGIYIISSAVVWAAIIGSSGVLLRASPHFAQMLMILCGGAVWFVILMPATFFKGRRSS